MARPVVAIVGRPNVGKSTFFNKLIGERRSIVEDVPGVTRDRIYGECEWCGRKLTLIDTGGIEPKTNDIILSQMKFQAEIAVDTVARDTGNVLYDRATLSDQFIEKRAFSHVGTAHDGHNRSCHISHPTFRQFSHPSSAAQSAAPSFFTARTGTFSFSSISRGLIPQRNRSPSARSIVAG